MRWLNKLFMRCRMLFLRGRAGDRAARRAAIPYRPADRRKHRRRHERRRGPPRCAADLWQPDRTPRPGARDLELAVARIIPARPSLRGSHPGAHSRLHRPRDPGDGAWNWRECGALYRRPLGAAQAIAVQRPGPSRAHLRGRRQRPLSGQHRGRRHLCLLAIAGAQLRADGHQAMDALRPRRRWKSVA